MNLVDVAILLLIVAAVGHGVTQGAALQVLSFGGLWAGLLIGAVAAPFVSGRFTDPFGRAFATLFCFFGVAVIGGVAGRTIGVQVWSVIQRAKLGAADSILGAAIAIVATLLAVWLLSLVLAAGPTRPIAAAMHESRIVNELSERLPPQPQVFSRLRRLMDTSRFPQVFEGLEPPPAEPVDLPDDPVVQQAVAAARASTVRVFGPGCGGIQTGSGFVAAPGHVVTNAHVVAGLDRITVEERGGRRLSTTPVLFDPELDVAVLRVSGLAGPPLQLAGAQVERGTGGATLGHPGGGPFDARAAAVLRTFVATGRDIYGRNITRREVYQLQGQIREGNSGGPFVRPDGVVVGVVFAASTTDPNVGYALTSPQVVQRVDQARGAGATGTGPCAA